MGFIENIKRWFGMIFSGKAKDEFKVESITSKEVERFINRCAHIYEGTPDWLSENVRTVNFAKAIAAETARLTTLGIKIQIEGGARGEYLQRKIDDAYFQLTNWVEFACAYGTVILKPSLNAIDVVLPSHYMVTNKSGYDITGAVFVNSATSEDNKTFYTRLEYHRFLENGVYCITNKCYKGGTANDLSKPVAIEKTPWSGMQEEVFISELEKPLFAVLKMPGANTIDINSPLSLPVFADAIEELKDLDIAYSRNSEEIYDSQRTVLMDTDKLLPMPQLAKTMHTNSGVQKNVREIMDLPKFVRNVSGNGDAEVYHEINPALNTAMRREGIDFYLSQIGYKCGFSNGYMVFNQRNGMVTATQVEAEDRRTLQRIKSIRDMLEQALDGLIYALDKFADLYYLAPVSPYEVVYDFGDLTYNREEDRMRWLQYVANQMVPAWQYLVKFEGMTEEEAKTMIEEAKPAEPGLFGAE